MVVIRILTDVISLADHLELEELLEAKLLVHVGRTDGRKIMLHDVDLGRLDLFESAGTFDVDIAPLLVRDLFLDALYLVVDLIVRIHLEDGIFGLDLGLNGHERSLDAVRSLPSPER